MISKATLPCTSWHCLYLWSVGLCYRVAEADLKKSSTEFWRVKKLFLQNLLVASKHPYNSLLRCCSLFIRISALKHVDASFGQSRLLSHVRNLHGPLLRLRPKFFSFFESGLLPNFKKFVDPELLIMESSNWETSPAS
jgi:hypothetical protein